MLLQRGQTIAGVDAVQLRTFLRRLRDTRFTLQGLARLAEFDAVAADELLPRLADLGLIERVTSPTEPLVLRGDVESIDGDGYWTLTVAGRALSKARIGKPMSRTQARALLAEVLIRAEQLNDDPDGFFLVESIELYGSLAASGEEPVGDIDLRVLISSRLPWEEYVDELFRRYPGGLIESVRRAQSHLRRTLSGGSTKIDIHLDQDQLRPLPAGAAPILLFRRDPADA